MPDDEAPCNDNYNMPSTQTRRDNTQAACRTCGPFPSACHCGAAVASEQRYGDLVEQFHQRLAFFRTRRTIVDTDVDLNKVRQVDACSYGYVRCEYRAM